MARSKIAEMVEEEAARAEAEPDDDEDEDAGDPDPPDDELDEDGDEEAEPAQAEWQPLSAQAFGAALEREANRHAEALHAIFGPEFETFTECPLCHLLGVVTPASPVLDPTIEPCKRCRGYGEMLTGAQNPNNVTRQCPDCNGNGWVPVSVAVPQVTATNGLEGAPQAATFTIPPMPTYDPVRGAWVDPAGNVLAPAAG